MKNVPTVKNKMTKKLGKGHATKTKQRRWRESPPVVVGNSAASGSFTKKSPSRRSAGASREEVPGQYQSAIQSGDLIDISEAGFGGGESGFQLLEEGQDFDGELLLALGAAGDADQGDVRVHLQSPERVPNYKNRNRM